MQTDVNVQRRQYGDTRFLFVFCIFKTVSLCNGAVAVSASHELRVLPELPGTEINSVHHHTQPDTRFLTI